MSQYRSLRALAAVLAITSLFNNGCTRAFYRDQADAEAYHLIEQKLHPDWNLPRYDIDVDPRSRMYDPDDKDFPPMPPDDPVSHQLMHCIDCKKGYPCWHANGDTPFVQNPDWEAYVPFDEDGVLTVDQDEAFRLALLNSRDYQSQLETLYLSALDVSFERFRFDAQFYGGYGPTFTSDGRIRGGGSSSSELDLDTDGIRIEKLFPAGGELVVGFANSLIWQFSGSNSSSTTTLLDFALIQPLLRGGGRDRVMERLTIAERALLANVRQMERFRRGFYLDITTGRDAGSGPSRRGGVFGAGLQGFSGVGGGGFGGVGGGRGGVTGGAGAARAGGYLGLLQEQQNIRNQATNITALRSSLAQLESFFVAGRIDYFQVELARQALYNSQSQQLNSETAYRDSLDNYKIALGLPPEIDMEVQDDILDQFNLVDPAITPIQEQLSNIQERVGQRIVKMLPLEPGSQLEWTKELAVTLEEIRGDMKSLNVLYEKLSTNNIVRAATDIEFLSKQIPGRVKELELLKQRLLEANNQKLDASIIDVDKLKNLPSQLTDSLTSFRTRLAQAPLVLDGIDKKISDLIAEGEQLTPEALEQRVDQDLLSIPNLLAEMSAQVLELTLIQVRARTESIGLVPVDMSPEQAVEVARQNRRDWMNARASLVDNWRLVQFNANDLESSLDIVFSGDISNTGNNPAQLRDATGQLRVGLQFDAPITRLSERNTYRQSLIEYQQARRSYYSFEDQITRGLRSTLRTIDLHKLNFELRRAAVHVAVAQVELSRLRLQEPPKPNEDQVFGATTARDLVTALTDLLNVQNDFLSVWVNYEVQRRSLDFDMGTMQVDSEGIWIDPGPIVPNHGYIVPSELDAAPIPNFEFPDLGPTLDGPAEEIEGVQQ